MEINFVTSSSVTLKWKPPKYTNGVITKYSIHYDGVDIDHFGVVSDTMIDTIEGLSPDNVYVLKMKAHTRVGPGPPVSFTVKTRKLINGGVLHLELHINCIIITLYNTSHCPPIAKYSGAIHTYTYMFLYKLS